MDAARRRSRMPPDTRTVRPVCARCRRPVSVCYCAALTTIETVTRVVILQHPREEKMPIGTARMATLCLPRAKLHVGLRWEGSDALRDAVSDPAHPPILLWPGPGARDVLGDPPPGPVTLIVVDGTWSQAKTLVRENPTLAALPRYAFLPPAPSEYRIRREPSEECVSTIEALTYVLGALEGDVERFRALLSPLREMVDRHLAAERKAATTSRFCAPRNHGAPGAAIPAAIRERPGDLVCAVGEANVFPQPGSARGIGHELVHWVARRVATGETFDLVAAPERPLAPRTASHLGLDEERLRGGVPRADLVAAFARWLRPDDVLCSWGHFGPRVLRDAGAALPAERIDVRAVARALSKTKLGSIEQYAARFVPPVAGGTAAPPAAPFPDGRAGPRLALLCAIVEAWRSLPPS